MDQHNTVERRLKTDIHYKNALRKDLMESVSMLHNWQERLHSIHNVRKEKKLRRTVARYRNFVAEMKAFLAPLLDQLEEDIKEEMSFSEEEISEFKEEVKEESKLAAEARKAFEQAQKAAEEADGKDDVPPEELKKLKDSYSKAWRAFRLENHKLDETREELESEQIDREIFKNELKRINVERHFIQEV